MIGIQLYGTRVVLQRTLLHSFHRREAHASVEVVLGLVDGGLHLYGAGVVLHGLGDVAQALVRESALRVHGDVALAELVIQRDALAELVHGGFQLPLIDQLFPFRVQLLELLQTVPEPCASGDRSSSVSPQNLVRARISRRRSSVVVFQALGQAVRR